MISQRNLTYRIGAGKGIGLLIGLMAFISVPYFLSDVPNSFRWAVLLWYPTLGAMVGVFGIYSSHPVLSFKLPWWVRGALIGAWMNFLLTLFMLNEMSAMVAAVMGEYSRYASPYFMVLEGALVGLLIDYILTRVFGDGWVAAADAT